MASMLKKKKQDKKERDRDKEELDRLSTLTEDQLMTYYKEVKNGIWDTSWEMLNSDGWRLCSGRDSETGVVYSKHYSEYGKVFKLEGYIEMNVEEAFKLLVVELESAPQWNQTITEAQVLMTIDDESDIAYNATSTAAGGLIATRDFVNLRHWSSRGDTTLSAGKAVLHPSKPHLKHHVRGYNGPGGWAFRKVSGSPDRCLFVWLMNTDLKGWLPKGLVDTAYPKAQLDYLENVRQHIRTLKGQKSDQ